MKRVFLIGYPVAHSVSPEMQNVAFQALELDWQYELLLTQKTSLLKAVERLRQEDCAGANVTIPHKEAVIPYLDDLSVRALRMRAVNTITKCDNRLIGENTDGEGFRQVLTEAQVDLVGRRVAILGAGGAARAVAFALGESGVAGLALINRTRSRAEELAETLRSSFPRVELTVNVLEDLGRALLIVNATSVGMSPNVDESPMPRGVCIPAGAIAVDLIYRPRRTRFLEQAEEAGARTIDGLGMLVQQGAAALRLWSRREPPVQVMFQAAERALVEYAAEL